MIKAVHDKLQSQSCIFHGRRKQTFLVMRFGLSLILAASHQILPGLIHFPSWNFLKSRERR